MGSIPRFRAPRKLALSSFVLLFFHGAALQAQTVVVTGAREPLSVDRLAADVVVIDAEMLRASTADSLADLLRREAGVQLSRAGGPGQASGVFLRGANAGQTAVFVDGVRIGSATLGLPALETLSLAQVERIEVLRGPGSSLYGADAVGGVVHIFTKQGGAPRADVAAAVGGYGSRQASASAGGSFGPWDLAATLAHEGSDGVSALRPNDAFGNYNPDRDGYRLDSAQARVGFKPLEGQRVGLAVSRNKLNAQYDSSEFAPPSFAQDNTPDFRNHGVTQTVALDWRGTLAQGLAGSAKVAHGLDDLKSGGNLVERFTTKRDQAGVQLAWDTGAVGRLVGALEASDEKAVASSFAFEPVRRNRAAVMELTGDAQGFSWQADLRRDHSSDFGGVTTARLGGAWAFVPGWKLRALAGSTFRAPSFNDLYFPGYGVATLRPEKGTSVEAGLAWRGESADAQLTVFRNRVRDLIGYQSDRSFCPADPAYDFGCASNVARARLTGATLGGSAKLNAFTLRAGVDFLDAKDADSGQRLPRRAAHQANLGLDWSEGAWSAGGALLRLGARPDGGVVLAAETTLDLKAAWRFAKGWSLEAKLLNATDERVEPARDYQGLGRQGWLGLHWGGTL